MVPTNYILNSDVGDNFTPKLLYNWYRHTNTHTHTHTHTPISAITASIMREESCHTFA